MAQTVSIIVRAEDHARLAAVVADRNRPQKHVLRARIILLSADKLPVVDVARQAEISRPAVWRWQQRFAEEGVEGLLRDKTRKPGKAPLSLEIIAKVLALPCTEPPGEATHWTGRMVAKAVGISLSAVQRLWDANRLQPHRLRTFKKSNDPAFVAKVEDVVGLYMSPQDAKDDAFRLDLHQLVGQKLGHPSLPRRDAVDAARKFSTGEASPCGSDMSQSSRLQAIRWRTSSSAMPGCMDKRSSSA